MSIDDCDIEMLMLNFFPVTDVFISKNLVCLKQKMMYKWSDYFDDSMTLQVLQLNVLSVKKMRS